MYKIFAYWFIFGLRPSAKFMNDFLKFLFCWQILDLLGPKTEEDMQKTNTKVWVQYYLSICHSFL